MIPSALRTLLKAACAACGLDEKTLAARAGISQQRGYDLINDRALATDAEIANLLTATGIPPSRVVELVRDADQGATAIELAVRIRASLGHEADLGAALRTAELKIDALTIVANPKTKAKLVAKLRELGLVDVPEPKLSKELTKLYWSHLFVEKLGVGVQYGPKPRTRKTCSETRGKKRHRRQRGSKQEQRFVRVEMTRFSARAYDVVRRVLRLLDLADHNITRLDLAIDIEVPFSALHLLPSDVWKRALVYQWADKPWAPPRAKKPHERIYLSEAGAVIVYEFRRAGLLVRVYDWNHRHANGRTDVRPRTRIEVQLRPRHLRLEQLGALPNPFRDLCFVGRHSIKLRRDDYVDSLVLRECGFYSPHLVLRRLSKRWRKRALNLLEQGLVSPQPWRVFDANWAQALRRFFARLGLA